MFEISSSDEYDSDRIDSDVEAELYSSLHHEIIPVNSGNNVPFSKETCSNKSLPAGDIITIISEDEDDDVIPINISNQNDISVLSSASSSISSSSMSESPKRKKCKVTNLTIDSGNGKKKSNIVANLLKNIQAPAPTEMKNQQNHNLNSANSPGNRTIELSDSEDSKDFSDLDSPEILTLHTNMSKQSGLNDSVTFLGMNKKRRHVADTISLKSDSDEDSDMFEFNLDTSFGNTDSSKDLWYINDTDLYRSKRKSAGRYHEDAVIQCTNCSRKGHSARNCVEPKVAKCVICGGAHNHYRCKRKMCSKCLRYGHNSRYCFLPIDQFVCTICNMQGHLKKVCPDLWRRYHLTTSGEKIRRAKRSCQDQPIFCFNCGAQGHFGFQCRKKRMVDSYPTLPAVVSYEHPLESLMCSGEERMIPNSLNQRNEHPVPPPVPFNEMNPTVNGIVANKNTSKKVSKKKLKKQQSFLQKRVERRIANIHDGKNNPLLRKKSPDQLKLEMHTIQEELKTAPNRKIRRRLKTQIKTRRHLIEKMENNLIK